MTKYTVAEKSSLLQALEYLAPGSSKIKRRQWIEEGRILLDGKAVKKAQTEVHPGQVIALAPCPLLRKRDPYFV